jgi:hypothetical protein
MIKKALPSMTGSDVLISLFGRLWDHIVGIYIIGRTKNTSSQVPDMLQVPGTWGKEEDCSSTGDIEFGCLVGCPW